MRVITYILLTLSCLFAINVFVAASSPSYKTFLQEIKSNIIPGYTSATTQKKRLTAEDIRNDKLIQSLDRLSEKVEAIQVNSVNNLMQNSGATLSGATNSGATTSTGIVTPPKPPVELTIPGALLARLMPQFLPSKVENVNAFGLKTFDSVGYATFADNKKRLKIYVLDITYDAIKSVFKTNEKNFKMNETDTFFGYTFFLNPTKKDNLIRFVMFVDGKTIGVETMKNSYPLIKKLLTK
jgi:hypothetical protein